MFYLGRPHRPRAQGAGPLRAHHLRRAQGEPPARHPYYPISSPNKPPHPLSTPPSSLTTLNIYPPISLLTSLSSHSLSSNHKNIYKHNQHPNKKKKT
jgi:hypothetical protein